MSILGRLGIDPGDLTEDEAAELAGGVMRHHRIPYTMWMREDVAAIVNDVANDGRIPKSSVDAVIDGAWTERSLYESLGSASDGDWEIIHDAINETIAELGIEEPNPCDTDDCDGDLNDGEGWDGKCGNCADKLDGADDE